GVGEKRKNRLLRNLGSISKVAEATIEQLSPFVGRKTAEDIFEHFRRQRALAGQGGDAPDVVADSDVDAVPVTTPAGEPAGLHHPDDPTVMTDETIADEHIETRLVDPDGDAEDLQPIRSVDQAGEVRRRRKSTRKRGERSTNPHAVKREKLAGEEE
ncbi:MAG TPA: hypothetical protein VF621_06370, partial [Pyrinomonadaceae bacterium]